MRMEIRLSVFIFFSKRVAVVIGPITANKSVIIHISVLSENIVMIYNMPQSVRSECVVLSQNCPK